jgi:hypothetical protein
MGNLPMLHQSCIVLQGKKKKERKKWQQGNECSNQRSAKKKGT